MKNFKKVLALVLAVATLMSFATIASALTTSASYKDAAAIEKNGQTEAVDVLSAIGVLTGYPDTNFKPDQDITRAEAAKIIAMFDNGSVDISSLYTSANPFTDVKGNWAESYVAYGYKAGIIAGVGKLLFAPNAKLTGVQFLKMVLVVLGYDAKTEGLEGTSWAVNTLALAKKIGLLNGLSKLDVAANLTRGQAAQIMLNALDTYTVEYGQQYKNNGQYYYIDAAGNRVYVTNPIAVAGRNYYVDGNYITVAGAVSTGEKLYKGWNLDRAALNDAFMRPGHKWVINSNPVKTIGEYWDTPAAKYTTKATNCTMLVDLGIAKTDKTSVLVAEYLNGGKIDNNGSTADAEYDYTMVHDSASKNPACELNSLHSGQGTLTEVYYMGKTSNGTAEYRVVEIETFLANVKTYTAAVTTNGHTTSGVATLNLYLKDAAIPMRTASYDNLTHDGGTAMTSTYDLAYTSDSFVKGDQVLVTYSVRAADETKALADNTNEELGIQSVTLAKSTTSTLNGFTTEANTDPSTTKIDSTWTPDAAKFYDGYVASKTHANEQTQLVFFYDIYGNVIATKPVQTTLVYNVIDSLWRYGAEADGSTNIKMVGVGMDAKKTDVVGVSKINGKTASDAPLTELIDEAHKTGTANLNYYDKLYTFTINASGKYVEVTPATTTLALKEADKSYTTAATTDTTTETVAIKAKDSNVRIIDTTVATGATTSQYVAVDNNTVFLIHEEDGTYTSYTGKDAIVTDINANHAEIIFSSTGYAKIVYLYNNIVRAGQNNVGYIAHPQSFKSEVIDGTTYDLYTAYIAGKETVIRVANVGSEPTKFGGNYLDGFYTINFTSVDGVVVAHIARVDADAKENTIYTITNHSFNSDKTAATITVAGNDQSLNVTADTKVYIVSGQAITTGKVSDITDTTVGTVAPNVGKIYNAARIVMSTTGTNNVAELYIMSDVYTSAAAGTFDTWTK